MKQKKAVSLTSRLFRLAVMVFAAFPAITAFAGRYWRGATGDALFSDTENWATESGGAAGASLPGSSGDGTTYFRNYLNGFIVFNVLPSLSNNVRVDTASEAPFVWRATEPGNGFTTTGYIRICEDAGKSPAHLKIESGTYTAKRLQIGYADNSKASLAMDGGIVNLSEESSVGCKSGCTAELTINEGAELNTSSVYFYVGENGTARMTMNGGSFTMGNASNGGLALCRRNDGANGTIVLNGGTLTIPNFRVEFVGGEGSSYPNNTGRIVFNGTEIVPNRETTDFLNAAAKLTCELGEGGLVVDTDGFDITIAHDLILGDGVTAAPLVKKGAGKLTITGATPFAAENIIVYGGTAVVGKTTYNQNAGPVGIDVSEGGSYGPYALHRDKLEAWLEAPLNFTHFSSSTANGGASYEMPEALTFSVGPDVKTWTNLKTGETYQDTLGGVDYTFTTKALAPRTIKIDAPDGTTVANVRDIGSWPLESLDGKKMNQNVLLRGANLDGFRNATEEERSASFLSQIGLKTVVDLRPDGVDMPDFYRGVTTSFAADDCEYVNCGMDYTGGPQLDSDNGGNFTNMIHMVFSKWGTPEKLPSYFHCRIGRDRTGIVGFLVLGLMGVEEEVLYRDYLMSNFAKLDSGLVDTPRIETCLRYLHSGHCNSGKYVYDDNGYGRSVAARCRAYLEMCGVTTEEIGVITKALSGETPAEVLARVDAYESENGFRTVSYVPYEGAGTTNAMHRLAAGRHILPIEEPVRDGYVFAGWNTDSEIDTGDGTAVVYADWEVYIGPETRYWSDENGASEKFNRRESWDPQPGSMSEVDIDTLVLNKGVDKIASLVSLDSVKTANLFVGEGESNLGGRLEMSGGMLTVTNYFRIGVDGSAPATNIVNISNASLFAKEIRTGHGDSRGGDFHDELNISGGGYLEATGETRFTDGSAGLTYVNITEGGAFKAGGTVIVGYSGRAVVNVSDSTFEMNGKNLYVGNSGNGTAGEISFNRIVSPVNIDQLRIAHASGSVGRMAVSGDDTVVNVSYAAYIGDRGNGELTINGGLVSVAFAVQFGDDGVSGNTGVMNLNGGTLTVPQVNLHGSTTGIFNWNGGILEKGNNTYVANGDMCPANPNLTVRVLEGGAFYRGSGDYAFSQPISGSGAFTKLGSGTLTLGGEVNLKGGFKVEAGTLKVSNIARTYFKTIEVASGAALNLNGAEVTVERYVSGGREFGLGTYTEYNGVIHVVAPVTGDPATAVWINSLSDGDLQNSDNWMVKNAEGRILNDTLPDENTDVFVYPGVARPDFTGFPAKSVSLVAETDTYLRGNGCTPPAVVKDAKGWYDFDDASTVTLSGETSIYSVKNKGTAGEALDAEVYGYEESDPAPLYGVNSLHGRNVMSMTSSDQDETRRKGLQTPELGLTNNQDRAIIVVSRRGTVNPHYPLGIEPQDNTDFNPEKNIGHFRIQRFGYFSEFLFCNAKSAAVDETTGETTYSYESKTISAGQGIDDWSISLFQSDKKLVTAMMYSAARGLTSNSMEATDLNTQESARLYIGHARFNAEAVNRGQVAEALYYDRALSQDEITSVYDYLRAKWLSTGDVSNIPPNILLENNSTLDFGGGNWTFDKIKGSGTIGTASVTVTGSIEPGLVVGGAFMFAPGATIDITPWDKVAPGSEMTFLTAESITNWPREKLRSPSRFCKLRLVENDDGTVSLKGTIQAAGMRVILR